MNEVKIQTSRVVSHSNHGGVIREGDSKDMITDSLHKPQWGQTSDQTASLNQASFVSDVAARPSADPSIGYKGTQGPYVPENADLDCYCSASDLGQPKGRLRVYRDSVLTVSGSYGNGNETFTIQGVTRRDNGVVFKCVLDWATPDGQDRDMSYTVHVACEWTPSLSLSPSSASYIVIVLWGVLDWATPDDQDRNTPYTAHVACEWTPSLTPFSSTLSSSSYTVIVFKCVLYWATPDGQTEIYNNCPRGVRGHHRYDRSHPPAPPAPPPPPPPRHHHHHALSWCSSACWTGPLLTARTYTFYC